MQSPEMFDSFLQQFNYAIQERHRSIARENLNQFFINCRKFYSTIEASLRQDIFALKILVRMTAVLPINKDNMIIGSEAGRQFASLILNNLSNKLEAVWPTIKEAEWPSFREGLVTLSCIKLLHLHESEEVKENTTKLLASIPIEEKKQEIVLCLLNLIRNLQCTLPENQEAALYSLVGKQHLTLEHLELANSIETYISYLAQVLIGHQGDVNELERQIHDQLNKLFKENRFVIKSTDIQFLLNYMKSPSNENEVTTKQIKFILETNNALRNAIGIYLNSKNYDITLDELPFIHEIIFRSYNQYILHNINRPEYLSRSLSRRDDRTAEFFTVWFRYFLCEPNEDWVNYKLLLGQWTECFVYNQDLFSSIIQQFDILIGQWINAGSSDAERLSFFIKHMVQQCLRQSKVPDLYIFSLLNLLFTFVEAIYDLLQKSLDAVKNSDFIDAFKKEFFNDILKYNMHLLKQIHNHDNPLYHLIDIDRQGNGNNKLVKDLINLATSLINITSNETLSQTFSFPSRQNFVYSILFNQSFNSSQLYREVIDHLIRQWKQWTAQGIRGRNVLVWKNYSREQRAIVKDIWALVRKVGNERIQIEALFEANHRKMQEKIEMKDKIVACLETYCENAIDKDVYLEEVRQWYTRLEQEIIQMIQIPKMLQDLFLLATNLHPYVNVRCWRAFLRRTFTKHQEGQYEDNLSSVEEPGL